jgi:hypothetical protein
MECFNNDFCETSIAAPYTGYSRNHQYGNSRFECIHLLCKRVIDCVGFAGVQRYLESIKTAT